MKKKACFFVHTKDPTIVDRVEFYKMDVEILRDLGFDVQFAFSYRRIPSDIDLYFVWWWTYAIFPVLRAKFSGKKTIITGTFNFHHHVTGADYYSRPFYHRFLIRRSAQLVNANVMVSRFEYGRMLDEITSTNVFYSPHVLKVEKYLDKVRRDRQRYIFTVSWMNHSNAERKCIPEIIRAARILKERDKPFEFIIAGKIEPDARYLLDLVEEMQVSDTVRFIGDIGEKEKIDRMSECGIYLQPTMFEGFGVAIAEALLCGAPTITSRLGGVPEVTGDHCSYVDGKKPEQIAGRIEEVFGDYGTHLELAMKGSAHIQEQFYYDRRRDDIAKILKDLDVM